MELTVLLQVDLVESTRRNVNLGDCANNALRLAHDAAARELLTRWRGHELERSDGFLFQFPNVHDAVEYALEYHAAACSLRLLARAGIHVGRLQLSHNSEEFVALGAKAYDARGLSIAMTARIMAIAGPRQTLLSAPARTALADSERRIVSHGHWRLKGFEDPVEVFEVGEHGQPFGCPPDGQKAFRVIRRNDLWLPCRDIPHSLPAERNAFVGRRATLRELDDCIAGNARLLTVVGVGGTGKTRVAQHFGWTRLGDFDGGAWFCDLSNAQSLDGLCAAVAQGLELPLDDAEPVEQIGNALAGRGLCLVILDNFEQLVAHALRSLGRWLDRAIGATFLVTSRSTLGLDGEQVLSLAPLDEAHGVQLFYRRASSAIGKEFGLGPGEEDQVRALVRLLDGLPLAIELAAARARVFDLRTLLARMRDRFKLLTSGEGRTSRQATLRATFDWSWELLHDEERAILAALSVFEGGFGLDAVEDVCTAAGAATVDSADSIQSLIEKSWVLRTAPARFGLLKTVHEYAAQKLLADAARQSVVEDRHAAYFASVDEEAAIADRGIEVDNLIAATRRSITRGAAGRATILLERSWGILKLSGPYRTARDLADEVLALPNLSTPDRVAVCFVAGDASHSNGADEAAIERFESGLALALAAGSREQEARLRCALGECFTEAARQDDARANLEAALVLANSSNDDALRCAVLKAVGNLRQSVGDAADAQRRYEEALVIAQRLKDRRWEGGLYGNLGGMHHLQGHIEKAQRYYELAIERAGELGDKRWENNARCNLGLLLGETGNLDDARRELERASTSAREIGHLRLECVATCNLGVVCFDSGDPSASQAYYERALELALALNDMRTEAQTRGYLGVLLSSRGHYDEACSHFDIGEALLERVGDDLSLGLLLCQRAEAEINRDDPAAALRHRDRAREIAGRLAVKEESPLGVAITRSSRLVTARTGR